MEFDKSRVYTAVNADELPIGSKCVFADTIFHLRKEVTDGFISSTLERIESDDFTSRFVDNGDYRYIYAYLIEPPAEPKYKYKPFESVDKAIEAIKAHDGWVEDKEAPLKLLIVGVSISGVLIGRASVTDFNRLFSDYVFVDDGSPCGELVEE